MNKIKTIKIKDIDGSVGDTEYLIAADASNVEMRNDYSVQETIGTIDVDKDGSIAVQLKNLNDKIDSLINGES